MNLSRAFSKLLSYSPSPSSQSARWLAIRRIPVAVPQFSTASADASPAKRIYRRKFPASLPLPLPPPEKDPEWTPPVPREKDPADTRRPRMIPFQPKVANAVQLVGTVTVPVRIQKLHDGRLNAVTVIVQKKSVDFPHLWIPIIFLGDLAHSACHLKEGDLVYVAGQLSGDPPPIKAEDGKIVQTNVGVFAHELSYVQNECQEIDNDEMDGREDANPKHSAEIEESSADLHLWNDLLANPENWWDNRLTNRSAKSEAFKHKLSGQMLRINESTPDWVLSKLDTLSVNRRTSKITSSGGGGSKSGNLWKDLVANPQQWQDNRQDKLNGLKKTNFPDFKNNVTGEALWCDNAPGWVLAQLDDLVFGKSYSTKKPGQAVTKEQAQTFEKGKVSLHVKANRGKYSSVISTKGNDADLWKDLVDHPEKWWDNRSNKLNPKSPDFKRKETGEGLWLSRTTPQDIISKLPPLDSKATGPKTAPRVAATLLS